MTIKCPLCSESEARTRVRQPFHYSFGLMLFGLLGGAVS